MDEAEEFERAVRRQAVINVINQKWRRLRRRKRITAWWWCRIPAAARRGGADL